MKILSFLAAALLAIGAVRPSTAAAQNAPGWAQALSSAEENQILRVVTDANNFTFVTGYVRGSATLGPLPLPVGGPQLGNGFVARLDAQGAVQWVRTLAPAGSGVETIVTGLALDAAGNAVFSGVYRNGALTLGAFALPAHATNPAQGNGLVAKLDPAGNVLWAQALTEPNASLSTSAVAVDAAGTAYVAVETNEVAYTSGLGVRTVSGTGVLGVRYDFPGVTGVAATSPLGVFGYIESLAVNLATGQLGAVGVFQGTLTLRAAGTGPALAFSSPPEPQTGTFAMSLTPNGEVQWAQQMTSTGRRQGPSTGSYLNELSAVVPAGTGFAVAGSYLGAGNLAGTTLPGSPTAGDATAVLGRFDGQGQLQWVRTVLGGAADSDVVAFALASDGAGQLHLGGSFSGQLAAASGGLSSAGGLDVFLLRYSDQGQLLGAQRDGGAGNEFLSALALDPTGQPRIVGDFTGSASLGGISLAGGARRNGFVARLGRTPLAARAASAAQTALQVFPNPSAGAPALQVRLLPGASPVAVRLLNPLGQLVHAQTVPARGATASVPTAGLAPGHYVLQVVSADGVATRGVVVE